ncbi:MAG TPA: VOC family protein [Ktedonobacterales bacterium]
MIINRSVPSATIIPVLSYENVGIASDWLCDVFCFTEGLRIGNHRAQLVFGEGAVILTERHTIQGPITPDEVTHSVHVRVKDVDQHYARAQEHGAQIVQPRPTIRMENGNTQSTTSAATDGHSPNRSPMSRLRHGAPRRAESSSHKGSA